MDDEKIGPTTSNDIFVRKSTIFDTERTDGIIDSKIDKSFRNGNGITTNKMRRITSEPSSKIDILLIILLKI